MLKIGWKKINNAKRIAAKFPYAVHALPAVEAARGYLRKFHLCRICFRELALQGQIPGVVKSSW